MRPPSPSRVLARAMRPVVAQLIRDIVADEAGGEAHVERSTRTLMARIRGMPPHLGAGMVGLTLAFDAWGLARAGKPYRFQSPDQRQARLAEWKGAPVGVLQDFVQFYEKMGTFVFWSTVEGEDVPHA